MGACMADRRALIIAPLYDGERLPPLAGRPVLLDLLTQCLETKGGYDVQTLSGVVTQVDFRKKLAAFFDSPGELLLYFYGHGCLGSAGLGYFATSDAAEFREGVLMLEVGALARTSRASEIVLIYDCCHAGAATPITGSTLDALATELASSIGRDLLAACGAHQSGWETNNEQHKKLGAFSSHILEGLSGAAVPRGSASVRGSALGEYVTRKFRKWNQDPITHCKEAGTRHCVITSGFQEASPATEQKKSAGVARIFGAPFKPSQLFVGRSAELDQLVETLVDGTKPIAVSATVEGLGGIGKTELVLQLLHHSSILNAFDAIVWLDGAGPLPPQWEKLAADADVSLPANRPKNFLVPLERGLRQLGHVLIVLDNARKWEDASEWIPPDFPLLVTTRTRDFGGNLFVHKELDVLAADAAIRFVTEMVPGIEADPVLPRLIEEIGGHALALELASWNMKYLGASPSDYLERLKKHSHDSEFALSATRYGNTVEGCLAITWNSLRHDASRTLWRRGSLFAPTSAHRDLLKVSALGEEDYRGEMQRMQAYIQESGDDDFDDPGLREARDNSSAIIVDPSEFDHGYAELRAFHVLSRVEGYNGERWAMHRIVRDFGRARLRKSEVMLHGMAIAEWLRKPTLPLRPEIPHIVATILDSARQQQFGERFFAREHYQRSRIAFARDARYFLDFIRNELNDPKALTLILEGLTDVNEDVRIESIRLLEEIGPIPEVLKALQSSLDDPDPRVRQRAGSTLAKHGSKKTIQILAEAARGPNLRARLTAIEALGLMREKAHTALKDALKSDDERVQTEAALLLCEQGQNDGVSTLLEKLKSVSGRQQARMVDALGESRDARALDSLAELLPSAHHRIRAIQALGKIGGERAYALVVDFLKDNADEVRCAAARAIDTTGVEEGISKILESLAATNREGRSSFPRCVQEIAKKRNVVLPIAVQAQLLKDTDWNTRMECAIQLGKARESGAVGILIEALGDSDFDVRREVAKALGAIGDPQATKRLSEIAGKDSSDDVKKAAKNALKQIGRN